MTEQGERNCVAVLSFCNFDNCPTPKSGRSSTIEIPHPQVHIHIHQQKISNKLIQALFLTVYPIEMGQHFLNWVRIVPPNPRGGGNTEKYCPRPEDFINAENYCRATGQAVVP